MPIYLVLLGSSLMVVRTAVGSLDNLQVDAVLIAGATAALLFGTLRRGGSGAVLLFVGAFLIHWIFSGLVHAPAAGSRARPRALVPREAIGAATGCARPHRCGSVAWPSAPPSSAFVVLAISSGSSVNVPHPSRHQIETKVAERIPMLRVPLSGAVAALGTFALWWPRSPRRRIGLTMLVLWTLSVPVGYLVYALRGHHLPLYRVVEFALAVPILAAGLGVGLVWIGLAVPAGGGRGPGRPGRRGGRCGPAPRERGTRGRGPSPSSLPARVQQVATAADYLEAVHARGPVVFVTELPALRGGRVNRSGRGCRGIWCQRCEPSSAVRAISSRGGRRCSRSPDLQRASDLTWRGGRTRTRSGLHRAVPHHAEPRGGCSRRRAPRRARRLPDPWPCPCVRRAARSRCPTRARAASSAPRLEMLVFLSLTGLGWAAGTTDSGWLSRVALSPAFGFAMLVLVAVPVARLGAPLSRTAAWAIVVATALSGWVVFSVVRADQAPGGRLRPRGPERSTRRHARSPGRLRPTLPSARPARPPTRGPARAA